MPNDAWSNAGHDPTATRPPSNGSHRHVDIDLTDGALARRQPLTSQDLVPARARASTSPVHSSEIAIRQLPTAWRGYDQRAVRSWLALVGLGHALLEDDAARSRTHWDESLRTLARLRAKISHLAASRPAAATADALWELNRATEALRQARRPATQIDRETMAVRQQLLDTPLRMRLFGVGRREARAALDAAAAHVARLENRAALLAEDNENLRDLLLELVSDADAR